MDINEIRKKEEERLQKVEELQKKCDESIKRKKRIIKVSIIFLTIVFMIIAVFAVESLYIQSILKNRRDGAQNKVKVIAIIPGGQWIISKNMEYYKDSIIRQYNNNQISQEEIKSIFETIKLYASTEKLQVMVNEWENILNSLIESKNAYTLGVNYEEKYNYLLAMESYQKVVKIDSYYTMAEERISEIKESYRNEIIKRAYELISSSDDLENANLLFEEAVTFFPKDEEFVSYQKTGAASGNPMIYKIAKTIYDSVNKIEKDSNHTAAECKEIHLYAVSNACVIVGACFHLDSPPGCYFYYSIGADGNYEAISAEDFTDGIKNLKEVKQISFEWNEKLEKDEKFDLILDNLIKLGPSYKGKKEEINAVSITEIKENNKAMEERIEENKELRKNAFTETLGQLISVIFVIWIVYAFIKKLS